MQTHGDAQQMVLLSKICSIWKEMEQKPILSGDPAVLMGQQQRPADHRYLGLGGGCKDCWIAEAHSQNGFIYEHVLIHSWRTP